MRRKGEGPGWSRVAFLSSLAAALFGAFYLANDTFIMHRVIVYPDDPFTAISFYLITGGWIGAVCTLAYNRIFGKKIDKDYPGFNLGTLKMQLFAIVSGAIAAASTAFCLVGNQKLDPSLVIGLSTVPIFYLGFYDSWKGYIKLRSIILPGIFVIVGALLTSVENLSGEFKVTLIGILVLLIGRSGTDALEKVVRQEGVWKSDAVTFNLWRFLWLSIIGTILVFVIARGRGKLGELIAIRELFFPALPWILLTMFFVFFYNTLIQRAMKTGAVSKISIVLSLQITLGIPIALIGNKVRPGIFGEIPSDPWVWIVRSVGIGLITSGIIFLRTKRGEKK